MICGRGVDAKVGLFGVGAGAESKIRSRPPLVRIYQNRKSARNSKKK